MLWEVFLIGIKRAVELVIKNKWRYVLPRGGLILEIVDAIASILAEIASR